MRFHLFAAVSAVALLAAQTPVLAQPQDAAATASAEAVSDADLAAFGRAMTDVRRVMEGVQGGQPTAEQQAAMASAITGAGLTIDRFNSLSTQISADPVLQARVALAAAPDSPAGSVAAGVTDAELGQFAPAYARVREIAMAAGGAPSTEQQTEMAEVIQNSGLTIERFNEISTALSSDQRLQARVALAEAQGS
jgi:hypothetical protein